ncbi:MAG: sugar ABC transporter substrate-binding protein [Clostridia bacterium]|nr:sugar ABC transporter substrate-binding protein [Clostridia bacterium]
MKKILALVLGILLVLSVFAGCAKPAETPADTSAPADTTEPAPEAEQFTVAINNWGQANFFARVGKTAMEEELTALGCKVIATVTDNIADRVEAIENMVQQGVDAIIIQEGDITECEAAILEAKEAGIIIGSMDSGTADYVDIYVSSDNSYLGKIAAETLVESMGENANGARVIEIINDAGSMIRQRKDASHEVFDAAGVEVAYSLVYSWPDYDADIMDQVSAILTADPDIDGVFATFDGVGISSYKAIKEFGLEGQIKIVGVDGDPDAYALMVADGESCNYICTMAQDPDTIARTCVNEVVKLLKGETLESNIIYIPGIKVTPANVADFVE